MCIPFKKNIYIPLKLYIYVCVTFLLRFFVYLLSWSGLCCRVWAFSRCGVQSSHGGGRSHCAAQTLGHMSSVLMAHGLSCAVAHEIFLDQGSNPWPLHWQVDSLPLSHQGSLRALVFSGTELRSKHVGTGLTGWVGKGRERTSRARRPCPRVQILCWEK